MLYIDFNQLPEWLVYFSLLNSSLLTHSFFCVLTTILMEHIRIQETWDVFVRFGLFIILNLTCSLNTGGEMLKTVPDMMQWAEISIRMYSARCLIDKAQYTVGMVKQHWRSTKTMLKHVWSLAKTVK